METPQAVPDAKLDALLALADDAIKECGPNPRRRSLWAMMAVEANDMRAIVDELKTWRATTANPHLPIHPRLAARPPEEAECLAELFEKGSDESALCESYGSAYLGLSAKHPFEKPVQCGRLAVYLVIPERGLDMNPEAAEHIAERLKFFAAKARELS